MGKVKNAECKASKVIEELTDEKFFNSVRDTLQKQQLEPQKAVATLRLLAFEIERQFELPCQIHLSS